MSRTLLVEACLNGDRTRLDHPALPITPAELAIDSARMLAAGAGAVHLHPRFADGRQTLDADACAAAVTAIRQGCPELPIG